MSEVSELKDHVAQLEAQLAKAGLGPVPTQYALKCRRCGEHFDARKTPPKQPCPACEGPLFYPGDER